MNNDTPNSQNIVRPVNSSSKLPMMIGIAIVIVIVGLGVGFFVSSKKAGTIKTPAAGSAVSVTQTEAGLKDVSAYKTGPIGTLQSGGIQGEGTYHLDRPGGATQTVYLNSTTVDMSKFVGKKVQVWGDTIASQHAPWLMDVVRIQLSQ